MSYIDDYLPKLYQWEAKKSFLYRDSRGLYTTMVGRELPNVAASQQLPWYLHDGSRAATPAEISADWSRVARIPVASFEKTAAERYWSPVGLMLQDEDIDRITRAMLMQNDAILEKDFPSYATAPAAAKIANLDMDWNLGEARLRNTYPDYDACFDRSDWLCCKANCLRNKTQQAFRDRNAWTQQLFDEAAKSIGV